MMILQVVQILYTIQFMTKYLSYQMIIRYTLDMTIEVFLYKLLY